jgi:hypothetical protein
MHVLQVKGQDDADWVTLYATRLEEEAARKLLNEKLTQFQQMAVLDRDSEYRIIPQ